MKLFMSKCPIASFSINEKDEKGMTALIRTTWRVDNFDEGDWYGENLYKAISLLQV